MCVSVCICLYVCVLGTEPGSLQGQQALLNVKPSFQPPCFICIYLRVCVENASISAAFAEGSRGPQVHGTGA